MTEDTCDEAVCDANPSIAARQKAACFAPGIPGVTTVRSSPEVEEGISFSEALENLKNGIAVSRSGWNRSRMFLRIQKPDRGSKMTEDYIYLVITESDQCSINNFRPRDTSKRVPWLASQTDILSNDWYIVSPQ